MPTDDRLDAHALWLQTLGREGERLVARREVFTDLSGRDLRRAILTYATIDDLRDADLEDAYLVESVMAGLRADRADFTGADLFRIEATESSFVDARLDRADLAKAQLARVDFTGASLRAARLLRVMAHGLDLTNADLSFADLTGAMITDSDFTGTRWDHVAVTDRTVLTGHDAGRPVHGPADLGLTPGPDPARPRPRSNYPVAVEREDGGYVAKLNQTVRIAFGPDAPDRYVVVASDTQTGEALQTDLQFARTEFFVTPAEHEYLQSELEAIAAYRSRTGPPLSALAGTALARLLTERIVPSDAFDVTDRYWLTDPA
jgi:hypothetical protein